MPRKLWIRTSTLLLALAVVLALAPASAWAQSKDELLKQAQAAEGKGDIEGASNAYCELAKQDTATYGSKCRIYSNQVSKERENDANRIKEGKAALASGDFDTAKQKFGAIKLSENKAVASDYLNNKIPGAQKAAASAQAAAQQQQQQQAQQAIAEKVSKARDAFNRKDYELAKGLLSGVNSPEALTLMGQITQAEKDAAAAQQAQSLYDNKVRDGDSLLAQGKYSDAENAYRAAAGLKGSMPPDLKNKIDEAQNRALAAKSGSVSGRLADSTGQAVTGATVFLEGGNYRKRVTTDGSGGFRFDGVPPGLYSLAAKKGGRLLSNSKLNVAASQSAVASLVAAAAPAGGAASEADSLEQAIAQYYKGSLDDLHNAELTLDGLDASGKKKALANFYLGATRLAQFYLQGEPKNLASLYADALDAFRQAKRVAGFRPPDEISPKIQKVWKSVR